MEKEHVIQALKATLISVKGALTIKQCNRDYRELQGEPIPYKKLGYQSLEQLFQDVPGFKMKQNANGEWEVDAIASPETQHIAAMVARQKPAKKSMKNYNRLPKRQGSWRKPVPPSSYSSNYNNDYSNQYYRAKSHAPFNNNSYNYRYNKYPQQQQQQQQQYSRSNEPRSSVKQANIEQHATAVNGSNVPSTSQPLRESNNTVNEQKHSIKKEKESRGSGKISASQRLSNLRDTLNSVDLLPLQLPAHSNCVENDVLVSHAVLAPALEPLSVTASSVDKLEWTCRKFGLAQPIYKTVQQALGHFCTIKVGNTCASSYPDSAPSEELAKETAAAKLLTLIESPEAAGLPTSSHAKTLAGLTALVADHEAGLLASSVPHLYREKYRENLPENWMQIIENCSSIIKERLINGLLLLLPNNEEIKLPLIEGLSEDTIDSDLPPLQFPESGVWNVFITVANSAVEVWVRIVGPQYSDAHDIVLAEMKNYYTYSGTTVDKSMIITNSWYAVYLDGEWQRGKVLDIEDDTATVFLGDHGDVDTVDVANIKILEPQFRTIPAQGIMCRLEGAEELAASEAGVALVRSRLQGATLVAMPGPRHDPTDPSVAVVIFDTSTSVDINVNKELIHDWCLRSGTFQITQKPCSVEVGCVSDEGCVWVSRAGGAETVRAALAMLTAGPYRRPLPAAPHALPPHSHALYIVRTLAGDWVRCSIISGLDGEGTVRTQLVDSGLILRAPLSSLVPLKAFSAALDSFPPQAQRVRLGEAEAAAGAMVARLRALLLGAAVLCRAQPGGAALVPPHVELFVRTGPQSILVSVNNSILMEYLQLSEKDENEADKENDTTKQLEALHKKKERIFRTASGGVGGGAGGAGGGAGGAGGGAGGAGGGAGGAGGGAGGAGGDERGAASDKRGAPSNALPPPALPEPGKCFDVYIAMAANPWNFVVQPNQTRLALQTMMATLQRECPKIPESEAPTGPASGELYVAYYDKDDSWYRVTIAGAVSSEMVSVYFCDYGDLALLETTKLRPVPAAAQLARTLPPQAIKARLYDVKPLHQDWTVEDCIRFQELCVEQQFVGICQAVGNDPLNPSEPLLTLNLIDTSTEEDIYLNKQLVAEGRASLASDS